MLFLRKKSSSIYYVYWWSEILKGGLYCDGHDAVLKVCPILHLGAQQEGTAVGSFAAHFFLDQRPAQQISISFLGGSQGS